MSKTSKELLIYLALLVVLFLTSVNISTFMKPKVNKILGAETQNEEGAFWQEFLNKNPDYVPGWVEIGKIDRAREIDPNYIIEP